MISLEYAPYFLCLGWSSAAAIAAMAPVLPGRTGRRHAAWLAGGFAILALEEAPGPGLAPGVRQLLLVAAGMSLWEFARRVRNDDGHRRISWATQLIPAEAMALSAAVALGTESAMRPAWFFPVEFALALLPGALGAGAALALYPCIRDGSDRCRRGLRLAAIAAGAYGLGGVPAVGNLEVLTPWLAVAGLVVSSFDRTLAERRAGVVLLFVFLAAAVAIPAAATAGGQRVELSDRARLQSLAGEAAAGFRGPLIGRLRGGPPTDPAVILELQGRLAALEDADGSLRRAEIRIDREGRAWTLGASGAPQLRTAGPEPAAARRSRRIVAPITGSRFDNAVGDLVLEYSPPPVESARHNGALLASMVALSAALAFSLLWRRAAEDEERLRLGRAEAASQAKSEFLAFLSHELRTPLHTVLGRTELLQRGQPGPVEKRHLDAIATQGRLLLRLVGDLLDLGTIEAGRLRLVNRPFSLRTVLGQVAEDCRPAAALKGLAFRVEVEPGLPETLEGDDARLRQILGNLVGNAVKFTSRGWVELRVSGARGDDGWRMAFAVRDSGPGLPEGKISDLFTLFTRLDAGDSHAREGTGVGLALVRRLCRLMGGEISAANAPGGGALFTLSLPFGGNVQTAPEPAGVSTQGPPGAARRLRVLVVEDNRAARDFLCEALAALGHSSRPLADGREVLQLCERQPFDVVLLDVNLPGDDGLRIARAVAALARRPRIVGCSAEAFGQTRDAALAAGMDAYLEKPVSIADLAAALVPGGAPADSVPGSLFDRLGGAELSARASALLADELPAALATFRAARRDGDTRSLRRHAHQLRSTALCAGNAVVAEACRRLENPDLSPSECGEIIEELGLLRPS